jgi:hypothetical protein
MDFTIKDRILLLNEVLPQFDSMSGIIIRMSIAGKLKLSDEESSNVVTNRLPSGVMEVGYKDSDGFLSGREIDLTDEELFYLKNRVRMIDVNGMISVDNIGTYRKLLDAEFTDDAYREKWDGRYPPGDAQ